MVFIKLTALLSVLALVAATPAPEADTASTGPTPYTFLALRSASPIHFGSINASGGKIWIGKETSSYCPVDTCPSGKVTAFLVNDTAAMDVVVPGGQQVYIDPTGALSFTQAHSAYIPEGSILTGFHLTDSGNNGITYFANSNGGFLACPADHKGNGPWQIFVDLGHKLKSKNVPSKNKRDCLGFTAAGGAYTTEQTAAWQYA